MSFMRRVNPGYIECLISEMQNLTDRMDEIIERDWNKFLNHVKEHQQKEANDEKRQCFLSEQLFINEEKVGLPNG